MGKIDTATIHYMKDKKVFADAFNFFVYKGEQVIDPDSLQELDTREIAVPYGSDGVKQPVQKVRDLIRSVTMTDNKTAYLLLAIENQANVHYAMPAKNLLYDALQYATQVEDAAASHRKAGGFRGASSAEYLSGFKKEDRLIPVITLVLYFSPAPWDGPRSLHEMFGKIDSRVLRFVPDYKINLIAPNEISETEFGQFQSSLKEVMAYIKYAHDKVKVKKFVDSNPKFKEVPRAAFDVLDACTNTGLKVPETEEVVNMQTIMESLIQDAEARGEARGEVRGEARGAKREREKAREKQISDMAEYIVNLELPLKKAVAGLKWPDEDKRELISLLQKQGYAEA